MTQPCLWEHVGNPRNRVDTSAFTPASLTTAEEQTQPRCPSTEKTQTKRGPYAQWMIAFLKVSRGEQVTLIPSGQRGPVRNRTPPQQRHGAFSSRETWQQLIHPPRTCSHCKTGKTPNWIPTQLGHFCLWPQARRPPSLSLTRPVCKMGIKQ